MLIPTYGPDGVLYDLRNLENVTIHTIARGLSRIYRYNGNANEGRRPLTVAQHSVWCYRRSVHWPPYTRPHVLLHDAHEFVFGDITRPAQTFLVHHGVDPAAIARATDDLDRQIFAALRLDPDDAPERAVMQAIDDEAAKEEARILFGQAHDAKEIWGEEEAYNHFLDAAREAGLPLSHASAVNSVEAFPPNADLADWEDLRGRAPDATGTLSSEAFSREQRDAWGRGRK